MTAHYQVHGDIAVITLDNPPVNGLGLSTRQGIAQGMEQALADAAVVAIVLTGAGKAFSGGADIREFGSPKAMQEPNLNSVIQVLEKSSKPVVAAIHGTALGGGLEVALCAHYRVSDAKAKFGLPEVKVGLFPGAGDTQAASFWTGLRPMTPDGTPILGETRYRNLQLSTGHGTLGWTMAAGTGRVMADLLTGKRPEIDMEGLTMARYGK